MPPPMPPPVPKKNGDKWFKNYWGGAYWGWPVPYPDWSPLLYGDIPISATQPLIYEAPKKEAKKEEKKEPSQPSSQQAASSQKSGGGNFGTYLLAGAILLAVGYAMFGGGIRQQQSAIK